MDNGFVKFGTLQIFRIPVNVVNQEIIRSVDVSPCLIWTDV